MLKNSLLFQYPIFILITAIISNLVAIASATLSQFLFVLMSGEFSQEPLLTALEYSFGAASYLAVVVTPMSLLFILPITIFIKRFTFAYLLLFTSIGLIIGLMFVGSYYWGVTAITFLTALPITYSLLVMRKQNVIEQKVN